MTDTTEVTEALDDDYAHDSFQFDLVMLSNGAALTMHKDPEAIQRADRIREYVGSLSELPIRDKSAEGRFLKAMALNCGSNVPCSECGCDLYDDFKRLVASYDSRQRRLASLRSQRERDEAVVDWLADSLRLAYQSALPLGSPVHYTVESIKAAANDAALEEGKSHE